MFNVFISSPIIRKTVSVTIAAGTLKTAFKAVLLGASGEQLKTFSLSHEANELPLDGVAAGLYTLRIEGGNEVMATQIVVP